MLLCQQQLGNDWLLIAGANKRIWYKLGHYSFCAVEIYNLININSFYEIFA